MIQRGKNTFHWCTIVQYAWVFDCYRVTWLRTLYTLLAPSSDQETCAFVLIIQDAWVYKPLEGHLSTYSIHTL